MRRGSASRSAATKVGCQRRSREVLRGTESWEFCHVHALHLVKQKEAVLVGITSAKAVSRGGGVVSVFTSVYSHLSWLKEQLAGL